MDTGRALATIDDPDPATREAAAAVLCRLDDPRAHAYVDAKLRDPMVDPPWVKSALQRDLTTAYDRLAPLAESSRIRAALFYLLPAIPGALAEEPRWLALAARYRRDAWSGEGARAVLQTLPREELHALIARTPLVRETPPGAVPENRDWLARYHAGEHERVWHEITEAAPAVEERAELRAEAYAVAVAMMERVRGNRDAVRATMTGAGVVLGDEAAPATDEQIGRLEALFGTLPIAIEAFYRVVGSIRLLPGGTDAWAYTDNTLEADSGLSLIALDPLEVGALREQEGTLEDFERSCAALHPEAVDPFHFDFAPDFLHKQDISGGGPYRFTLPSSSSYEAVDPWLSQERGRGTFVAYLRKAFAYGGFPILEVAHDPHDEIALDDRIAFTRVTGGWGAAADALLARLRRGLVPF